ncbi:ImmA/IrrE family metallo-endopeptidase [Paenibacillus larvae subsp. pulvifaciens]|uniref:ImmA/IrrE family metallo-endopeptidase n=1 Tax=Paenibacillus larvae subsp. pulvifaciens TaxID=1477 RepID=A0A1V0URC1_9BACL|nr:ImmA/IrrE family metallo-endopeptidase [Paenibacillus larvae]ARF67636.1 ImmA/IrrE family metallo-endopeptidase [Paenibacillus larvae subsp. pulvifaciens]
MVYEALLKEAEQLGVYVYEKPMNLNIKGLYADGVVCLNKRVLRRVEKACALAEEIGHHNTTSGNILNLNSISNLKQEKRARTWGHKKLLPLSSFVQAHKEGIRNRYELAEFLNITEEFLEEALKRYQEIYGLCVRVDNYTLCFEPLGIKEFFE